ncbi:MAG: hypothetical protein AB7N76_27325 [Planctomycetota bacterium]
MEPSANEAELRVLLKARCPLIYVVSCEEERVERLVLRLADELGLGVTFWSVTQGFCDRQGAGLPGAPESRDPAAALRLLIEDGAGEGEVYVLRDLHPYLREPRLERQLRDLGRAFRANNRAALLVSPVLELPVGLAHEVDVYEFALPNEEGIRRFMHRFLRNLELTLDEPQLQAAAKALVGLTELQCESLVARSLVLSRRLDAEFLARERERQLQRVAAALPGVAGSGSIP